MDCFSRRFYLVESGAAEYKATDLIISGLRSFPHEGNKLYEVRIDMPGILPAENGLARHWSSLEALLSGLETVRVYVKDFEKSGGKIYPCRFDDINQPWTGDGHIKAKDFLRIP